MIHATATAFSSPSHILARLNRLLETRGSEVQSWLNARAQAGPHLIYASVDLRNSGHKIAPVDTNVFPGGFNNLSATSRNDAAGRLQAYLARHFPLARTVLLVPESHTRNLKYWDNVSVLQKLLETKGLQVLVGAVSAETPASITTASGAVVNVAPMETGPDGTVTADGVTPDVLIINNDLSGGIPEVLKNVVQPCIPPLRYGWYRRRKSMHFDAYERVSRQFADAFDLDPWHLSAAHARCGMVSFKEKSGLECVALNVEKVLHTVREKYAHYGIADEPYVFIKADSGTYGMGIMTARSGEEVMAVNKDTRKKMNVIKEGVHNTEVIIQEGIPTVDAIAGRVAEPMIYVVDGVAVGGAYRVNEEKDAFSNLNSAGMSFSAMCDESNAVELEESDCDFNVYGLIASLAAQAAVEEN